MGDWRLFFADRDATAKVTPDAVNTAAATYFVRDNRVVGLFIPDDHPKRAPYMTTPDVKDVIAKATFKEEGDQVISMALTDREDTQLPETTEA